MELDLKEAGEIVQELPAADNTESIRAAQPVPALSLEEENALVAEFFGGSDGFEKNSAQ